MSDSTCLITVTGFTGAFCFAVCALPQIIKALKTKSVTDVSWGFIALSVGGNVFSAVYIYATNLMTGVWQWPQYFNYGVALALMLVLAALKWRLK